MKKCIARLFLFSCLITGFMAAAFGAASLPVKEFSTNFEQLFNSLDPNNPYLVPFTGLFNQTIKVGEVERTFKTYIPPATEHQAWSLFVILPSGENASAFLEESGWRSIADKGKFYIFMAEAKGKWDLSGKDSDIQYLSEVVNTTKKRQFYSPYPSGMVYLIGYKDGATLAQQAAMAAPATWSGLATFGALNISKAYIDSMAAKPSLEKNAPLNKVPLPAWIVADKIGPAEQAVIDYWKSANNVKGDSCQTKYATVFAPSLITTKSLIDAQPVAKVAYTVRNTQKFDPKLNEVVWFDFLAKTSRFVSLGNGQLREMATDEEVGMIQRNARIDGLMRQWQEFVPSIAREDPAYKMPLLVVFHGGGNAAKPYLNYLQWFKAAEERRFMVVLPQAYPNKSTTAIATPSWNATGAAGQPNDSNFVREMVKNIKSRHNIDPGRIYATGMSNGSMMTINVALTLSDVFTACGSTSGVILTGLKSPMFAMPGVITDRDIPIWIIMGENDIGGGTYEKNNDAKVTIEYFQKRNLAKGMDDALFYKNGIINHYVYVNAAGVPMVRYSIVDGKGHATMPSETWVLWDEFFCKYFRTDKGEILYEGRPIR
jgi:poly(3-hydroxybutyrate) depolymerase